MELSTIDMDQLRRRYAAGGSLTSSEWSVISADERWTAPPHARSVIEAHDLLLFIRAFPRNVADRDRASAGLARISGRAAELAAARKGFANGLRDSGIDGQPMRARFSIDLCRWLLVEEPGAIALDALEGEEDLVRNTLLALVHQSEREAMDDARHDPLARLHDASNGAPLPWLVNAIDHATADPHLRHALWETCGPGIRVTPRHSKLSRTWCEGLADPVHPFPTGTRELGDPRMAMNKPLLPETRLDPRQRRALILAGRGVLIGHQRETDPVTLANGRSIVHQRLDHGMSIALLQLPVGRRTAFDAYVGYVAFANNVPVAYGGAWIFPGKSKVGISVFPAFRGGPSTMLFAQVLRCYAQRYGVGCFEAENYQLGHGNADGIRSGAYWFYHRLGFRTEHPRLAQVAAAERERVRLEVGYRTPAAVLRKLVVEPMLLRVNGEDAPVFEPLDLSERVMEHLAATAEGDRSMALERLARRVARKLGVGSMRGWSHGDRAGFMELAPAVDPIPDLERWTRSDKQDLVKVMCAKGAITEDRYIARLRRHARLLQAWSLIASGGG